MPERGTAGKAPDKARPRGRIPYRLIAVVFVPLVMRAYRARS